MAVGAVAKRNLFTNLLELKLDATNRFRQSDTSFGNKIEWGRVVAA